MANHEIDFKANEPDRVPHAISDNSASDVEHAFIERALNFLLNHYLPKIERCLEQLTDEQIWWRPHAESNSIGNLILHLCGNARQWIICGLGSATDERFREAEFAQREIVPRLQLLEHLRATLSEVEAVMNALDPHGLLDRRSIQGKNVDVLEAVFHVTEHFSMHTGQILMRTKDLLHKDLNLYDFSNGTPVERWR